MEAVHPHAIGREVQWAAVADERKRQHFSSKVLNPSFHARLKHPYLNFSSFVVDLHPGGKKSPGMQQVL